MKRRNHLSQVIAWFALLVSAAAAEDQGWLASVSFDHANPAYPSNAPAWLPGFRLRYSLRMVGDLPADESRTVIARIPTGGWLKPDASDVLVQSASGKLLPVAVLAHDQKGHTIIQFTRHGYDRWYWVYLMNPVSPPRVDPAIAQVISAADAEAQAAIQAKMAAQTVAADRAEELRSANERVAVNQTTITNAANQIADKAKADYTTAALSMANAAVAQGQKSRADAAAQKAAAEQTVASVTATLPGLSNAVAAARTVADQAVETARIKIAARQKLAVGIDPASLQEGLTVEFREWAGDELTDWPVVLAGLRKSETVIGNAIVGEVLQRANPARPSNPRNFAASYRGFLKINTPGVYRFFVNGDDAAFLFIDGYKVYSRRGSNAPVRNQVKLHSLGADIELEVGVHPFEIHSVIGNTPTATGAAQFLWLPPGSKTWALVPRANLTQASLAAPAELQEAAGGQVAAFNCGMDDTLASDGIALYLVRFDACGTIQQPGGLVWDFGDGTTGTGQSPTHVYFQEGDFEVTLTSQGNLPPFRRRVHVWAAPVATSPLSLAKAIAALNATDLNRLDAPRLNALFQFLLICEQPQRWPLMEKLARLLLARPGLDPQYRVTIYTALMEALAQQGRGAAAVALLNTALAEIPKLSTLQAWLTIKAADIDRIHLKDYPAASALYDKLIAQNRRLNHPAIRLAAIALGDMHAESGDQARAATAYRLADTLASGSGVTIEKPTDATTRGALLRVAEQQLRNGNLAQSKRLLARIEAEFPEQKLEALYRYLRAEADHAAGRYETAIQNYETLLQLRQWAGYRGQVLFGLADCYSRLDDFAKALEWLKSLKEGAPAFYDEKRIADYRAMIEGRLKRQQDAVAAAATNAALRAVGAPFAGYQTGFEPGEHPAVINTPPAGYKFRPSLGIDGPYTGFIEAIPNPLNVVYDQSLRNITSEGWFWIELWYRDTLAPGWWSNDRPHIQILFYGDAGQVSQQTIVYLEPTYGEWRKVAAKLKSPVTKDGELRIGFNDCLGLYEFDGLRIQPVTDRQNEALQNFIEGAHPQ